MFVRSFAGLGRLVGWRVAETSPDIVGPGRCFLGCEALGEAEIAIPHKAGDLLIGEFVRIFGRHLDSVRLTGIAREKRHECRARFKSLRPYNFREVLLESGEPSSGWETLTQRKCLGCSFPPTAMVLTQKQYGGPSNVRRALPWTICSNANIQSAPCKMLTGRSTRHSIYTKRHVELLPAVI
jgi:hypothetical protein